MWLSFSVLFSAIQLWLIKWSTKLGWKPIASLSAIPLSFLFIYLFLIRKKNASLLVNLYVTWKSWNCVGLNSQVFWTSPESTFIYIIRKFKISNIMILRINFELEVDQIINSWVVPCRSYIQLTIQSAPTKKGLSKQQLLG